MYHGRRMSKSKPAPKARRDDGMDLAEWIETIGVLLVGALLTYMCWKQGVLPV